MQIKTTNDDGVINVAVDERGYVLLDDEVLTPSEAIAVAHALTQAVENSLWRDQIGTPYYTRTENILRRANSPLGQALSALGRVFA